ncbi:MAG: FHA domain-containing protein [Betaproteobacteria bacterium]|nr:FHA domain-containing protein [Betaproteobacteria bacterium]
MAKLILSMDGLVLKEISLSKERTTIGRKPHNDIQIDNLAVSGEHAVIVTILNDCFLEDLGSTNGTLVNGSPVKKHFLQNNDIVELGKYRLKFVGEAPVPAAMAEKADFEKTMVLRPSAMKVVAEQAKSMGAGGAEAVRAAAAQQVAASATAAGTAEKEVRAAPTATPTPTPTPTLTSTTPIAIPAQTPTPAPTPSAIPTPAAPPAARSPHPLGAIQILSGGNAGKELELAKPLTTLGKPGVQVAVLTRRPQGYFITHVEGANPPTVNGHAIGTAPHALKDHDVVELAGVKMEFFLKG